MIRRGHAKAQPISKARLLETEQANSLFVRSILGSFGGLLCIVLLQTPVLGQNPAEPDAPVFTDFSGPSRWITNGPAVFGVTDARPTSNIPASTNFHHFIRSSLNNAVWTNLTARTNGRNTTIWSTRSHPPGWPRQSPVVEWNTNCVMWGMKGLTAISPCWEDEGSSGQVPITALTRRHGYTRGHGMGPDGFTNARKGRKAWFLTTDNTVVEVKVLSAVMRLGSKGDYTFLVFDKDLPESIQPQRVVSYTNVLAKCPARPGAPRPTCESEQSGKVNTNIEGFIVPAGKQGDSGSPNMLPVGDELVFFAGRGCSGLSPEMQDDIDELSRREGLDPRKYQLQWLDVSSYPAYAP
jgi:hypothetical protein